MADELGAFEVGVTLKLEELIADAASVRTVLKGIEQQLRGTAENTKKSAAAVDDFGFKMVKLNAATELVKTALGGAKVAFDAVTGAATMAINVFDRTVGQASALSNEILSQSQLLRINTDALQAYRTGLEVTGAGVAAGTVLLRRMSLSLSSLVGPPITGAREAFEELNISVLDMNGNVKTTDVLLSELAGAFTKMEDGPRRNALGMAVFGRTFNGVLNMFRELGANGDDWQNNLKKFGLIIDQELIEQAARLSSQLEILHAQSGKTWQYFGLAAAPAFLPLVREMIEMRAQLIEWVKSNKAGIEELAVAIAAKISQIVTFFSEFVRILRENDNAMQAFGTVVRQLVTVLDMLWKSVGYTIRAFATMMRLNPAANLTGGLDALDAFGAAWIDAAESAERAYRSFQQGPERIREEKAAIGELIAELDRLEPLRGRGITLPGTDAPRPVPTARPGEQVDDGSTPPISVDHAHANAMMDLASRVENLKDHMDELSDSEILHLESLGLLNRETALSARRYVQLEANLQGITIQQWQANDSIRKMVDGLKQQNDALVAGTRAKMADQLATKELKDATKDYKEWLTLAHLEADRLQVMARQVGEVTGLVTNAEQQGLVVQQRAVEIRLQRNEAEMTAAQRAEDTARIAELTVERERLAAQQRQLTEENTVRRLVALRAQLQDADNERAKTALTQAIASGLVADSADRSNLEAYKQILDDRIAAYQGHLGTMTAMSAAQGQRQAEEIRTAGERAAAQRQLTGRVQLLGTPEARGEQAEDRILEVRKAALELASRRAKVEHDYQAEVNATRDQELLAIQEKETHERRTTQRLKELKQTLITGDDEVRNRAIKNAVESGIITRDEGLKSVAELQTLLSQELEMRESHLRRLTTMMREQTALVTYEAQRQADIQRGALLDLKSVSSSIISDMFEGGILGTQDMSQAWESMWLSMGRTGLNTFKDMILNKVRFFDDPMILNFKNLPDQLLGGWEKLRDGVQELWEAMTDDAREAMERLPGPPNPDAPGNSNTIAGPPAPGEIGTSAENAGEEKTVLGTLGKWLEGLNGDPKQTTEQLIVAGLDRLSVPTETIRDVSVEQTDIFNSMKGSLEKLVDIAGRQGQPGEKPLPGKSPTADHVPLGDQTSEFGLDYGPAPGAGLPRGKDALDVFTSPGKAAPAAGGKGTAAVEAVGGLGAMSAHKGKDSFEGIFGKGKDAKADAGGGGGGAPGVATNPGAADATAAKATKLQEQQLKEQQRLDKTTKKGLDEAKEQTQKSGKGMADQTQKSGKEGTLATISGAAGTAGAVNTGMGSLFGQNKVTQGISTGLNVIMTGIAAIQIVQLVMETLTAVNTARSILSTGGYYDRGGGLTRPSGNLKGSDMGGRHIIFHPGEAVINAHAMDMLGGRDAAMDLNAGNLPRHLLRDAMRGMPGLGDMHVPTAAFPGYRGGRAARAGSAMTVWATGGASSNVDQSISISPGAINVNVPQGTDGEAFSRSMMRGILTTYGR